MNPRCAAAAIAARNAWYGTNMRKCAGVEQSQTNPAVSLLVREQPARDQVPRDDEEHAHAKHRAEGQRARRRAHGEALRPPEMTEDHQRDRQCPKPVEAADSNAAAVHRPLPPALK